MEKEVPEFIRYEVEERKWSPNALTGVYLDENDKEKKKYILAIGLPKKYADKEIEKIKNFYNDIVTECNK